MFTQFKLQGVLELTKLTYSQFTYTTAQSTCLRITDVNMHAYVYVRPPPFSLARAPLSICAHDLPNRTRRYYTSRGVTVQYQLRKPNLTKEYPFTGTAVLSEEAPAPPRGRETLLLSCCCWFAAKTRPSSLLSLCCRFGCCWLLILVLVSIQRYASTLQSQYAHCNSLVLDY